MILDRVTIDIDHYEQNAHLKAVQAYYGLKNHAKVDEIVVHVSTGGKGIHLEGRLTERFSDDERMALRRSLNDDDKRANLDEERGAVGHATNIFWDQKDGNDHERVEMPDIWAAIDRVEANRADDYSRVKALALHGRKAVWDTHGLNRPSMAEACE